MMHLGLIARDLWVYGSSSPFAPDAMIASRRKKIEAKGQNATDDEVCRAVVDSSLRTNKEWNAAAEARAAQQQGYVEETLWLYLWPSVGLALAAYLAQLLWARLCGHYTGAVAKADKQVAEDSANPSSASEPQVHKSKAAARGAAALGLNTAAAASRPGASSTARRRSGTPGPPSSAGGTTMAGQASPAHQRANPV